MRPLIAQLSVLVYTLFTAWGTWTLPGWWWLIPFSIFAIATVMIGSWLAWTSLALIILGKLVIERLR